MKVIIIEDQAIAAAELSFLISELRPNYKIIKLLPSVKEAVEFLQDYDSYDLIFSDIQLIDGLSFEIFQQIKVKVPVIFCTAYDKFALDAFNANGISYILKPFSRQVLENALEKFESFTSIKNNQLSDLLKYLSPPTPINKSQSVLVHQRDKIIPIQLESIAYLKLDFGVVNLFTHKEENYSVS